ncbi:MAG: amino acid ABC transporter substrate-binding protein [Lactobacillaceae bacterium]|jgi:polar amino acid transport system substrate-binding protein|nr:amino acid ABC transporter substrate-binding protein [Lactobacillaceae bacterium]
MKKINVRRQIIGNSIVVVVVALIAGFFWYRATLNQDTWAKTTADKQVIIGVDDTYVPMGFRNKAGKLVGFDVDLARAVFKNLGLKVKFQAIDWSMKETELETGHIDMIWNGYTITPQRAKKVAFSKPYHTGTQVLVTMNSSAIDSVQEMQGMVLGLQTGSSGQTEYNQYKSALKQYVKSTVQYDTFDKALTDLQVGRIQAVLIDSDFARYYVAHEKDPAAFHIVDVPGYPKDQYGVGFRKGDQTLLKKVNAQLTLMAKNGTLDKISEKYFGTPNQN